MVRIFLVALALCAGGLVLSASQSCSQPAPIPTPAPTVDAPPADPFDITVNCSEVRPQVVAARPAVEVCLATRLPADGCMVDLLSTWGPGPLACAVRAAEMAAFAKLPTDAGTNTDEAVAKASRLWITTHGIGYKD